MFCPNCGRELPDGALFCGGCGSSVEDTAADEVGGPGLEPEAVSEPVVPIQAEASVGLPEQDQAAAAEAVGVTAAEEAAITEPAAESKKLSLAVKIAIPVAAACVAAAIAFAISLPGGQPSTSVDENGQTVLTATVGGERKEIKPLARPGFFKLVGGSGQAMTTTTAGTSSSDPAAAGDGSSQDQGQSQESTDAGSGSNAGSGPVPAPGDGGSGSSSPQPGGESSGAGSDGQAPPTGDAGDSGNAGDTSDTGGTSSPQATVEPYTVASDLSNVTVSNSIRLDDIGRAMLAENGFLVDEGQYAGDYEFYEAYEDNRYKYIPNFITVDSMMHTYHLYFSRLMKNIERGSLSEELLDVSEKMLAESAAQLEALAGSEWEGAAQRNVAFFAVGAKLLGSDAEVPSAVTAAVDDDVAKIMDASGVAESAVTGEDEDFSQYKPRGYYEGDAALEPYFRAMMWYGRMNFKQIDEELDRSAALMTLALHDAALDGWESVYAVTSFFAGASDDCGYYEYYPIMEAVYGEDATAASLAGNEQAWQQYHELTAQMPAPKINSVVVTPDQYEEDHELEEKGFRFMGQRFSLDAAIFEQLTPNRIGANAQGDSRVLPDALDVPAALGSDEALSILDEMGATAYEGYPENMEALRGELVESNEPLWFASLYSQWLYTLNPLLEEHGEGYPAFMQSSAWVRKNLQSYLGSYTELKHDTVLYAKQVMVEMGGGPPSADDRGYVEPEPEVFARFAALTQATSEGLDSYGMLSESDADDLAILQKLAEKLQVISEKELRGETPTDEEFELIRSYGGTLEHFWEQAYRDEGLTERSTGRDFPAAIVTDIATNADAGVVLEVGTGKVMPIYVVVPVDGGLRVAVGGVYSFYQFDQPLTDRLTDTAWRIEMGIEQSSSGQYDTPNRQLEPWTDDFVYRRETT